MNCCTVYCVVSVMRPKGSAAALEARRRLAVDLLQEGKTTAEVAEIVQAPSSSVRRWRAAWKRSGEAALAAKPHPGAPRKLTASQEQKLLRILLRGAAAAGFDTELWTCRRVAQVVEKHFDVTYHPDHLGRILHRLGWTPQKPARRARERDEPTIANWRASDWPLIKKKLA